MFLEICPKTIPKMFPNCFQFIFLQKCFLDCFLKWGRCNSVWWSPGVFDTPPLQLAVMNTDANREYCGEYMGAEWSILNTDPSSNSIQLTCIGVRHQAWVGNTFHLFIIDQPFHGINLFWIMLSELIASGKMMYWTSFSLVRSPKKKRFYTLTLILILHLHVCWQFMYLSMKIRKNCALKYFACEHKSERGPPSQPCPI